MSFNGEINTILRIPTWLLKKNLKNASKINLYAIHKKLTFSILPCIPSYKVCLNKNSQLVQMPTLQSANWSSDQNTLMY